jgi:hypothetical protein
MRTLNRRSRLVRKGEWQMSVRNSFQDRLAVFAQDAREKASRLPPGPARSDLLQKASRADEAAQLEDWARSFFSQLASR